MSVHTAVEGLKRLGLSNYEAQVFVALHRLGSGTTNDVSDLSGVPRSQVYGTADDLASKGLVEIVESSPKTYRPVGLHAARKQLRERIDEEEERAFESLNQLQTDERDHAMDGSVATAHGRHAISERLARLVGTAGEQVMLVAWTDDFLDAAIESALRERTDADVSTVVITQDDAVETRFGDSEVRTVVAPMAPSEGFTGRTLLVDEATVLLSVRSDDVSEQFVETALWTVESNIGRILAQFIHAGVLHGVGSEEGWADPSDSLQI